MNSQAYLVGDVPFSSSSGNMLTIQWKDAAKMAGMEHLHGIPPIGTPPDVLFGTGAAEESPRGDNGGRLFG